TEREWRDRVREAETWLLRAEMIGGSSAVTRADEDAVVRITWATAMGVHHPDGGICETHPQPILGSTALIRAQDAYRGAALAGVHHAAALAAVKCLAAEMESTRQRVRALNNRWIPRLRTELAVVEFELEELERTEAVRRLRSSAR
ncbi:V-type ATP synthase subunit D, partial [Kibdelosporangium lantanae]